MNKEHIIRSVLVAELLLLVPLLAMFFSEEVNWNLFDFIIGGILLAGVGVAYHLIVTGIKSSSHKTVVGIVLAAAIVLMWIELAVGLFGSPLAGS